MKEVKFEGLRPRGTLRPRRLWRPGESAAVGDAEAKELLHEPGFVEVAPAKPRRSSRTKK